MNMTMPLLICLWLALTTSNAAPSKQWQDIVPLRSTCADVKRALGVERCGFPDSTYYLRHETVSISFSTSNAPCSAGQQQEPWNVPRGTVLEITVFLKKPLPLSEFRVDDGKYEKVTSDFLDEVTYNNSEEGISLVAVNEEVRSIIRFPASRDKHLRCHSVTCPN